MSARVLVIATHPDDETLGCGGTLLRHAAEGDSLHWLLVSAAHEPNYSSVQVGTQAEQVEAVKRAYPFETLDWLKFPTTELDTMPLNTLVKAIRHVVDRLKPAMVFVPNGTDVHSDHRIVFDAAQAVLKSFSMRLFGVRRMVACEVLSETDAAAHRVGGAFQPNVFVDVTATLERKLEIMALYQSEIQPDPLPRGPSAIRALARYRGATIGVEYAEAFMLMREVF